MKDNNKKQDSVILCVIRVIILTPIILIVLISLPIMHLLGVKDVIGVWVTFNEAIVFNIKNNEQL